MVEVEKGEGGRKGLLWFTRSSELDDEMGCLQLKMITDKIVYPVYKPIWARFLVMRIFRAIPLRLRDILKENHCRQSLLIYRLRPTQDGEQTLNEPTSILSNP